MKKVPSIAELRVICKKPRPILYSFLGFRRFFSIYFTWLFIQTPLSANFVSFLAMFTYIMVGGLYAVADSYALIIPALVFKFLGDALDGTDGEVARYKKTFSPRGRFIDELIHIISKPIMYLGVAIYVFRLTNNPIFLVLGALAIMFSDMMEALILYRTEVRYENQHLLEDEEKLKAEKKPTLVGKVHKYLLEVYIAIQFQIFYILAIINRMDIWLWFAGLYPIILIVGRIYFDIKTNLGIPVQKN